VQHYLEMATGHLDPLVPDSSRAAIGLLAARVQREALVLSFNDVILLLGALFVVGLFLMPLVRRQRSASAG
jgi:DHA2 family multidrug resistance protein